MRKRWRIAALALLALAAQAYAAAADELNAFPPAPAGMTRQVIRLPTQEDEAAFKLELVVGKTVRIDAANRYFFAGRLDAETIPGWGYERYVLRELGPMAGTLMAPEPGAPQVERFIALGGEPRLLRYNSKLPVVVYVPEGVEVRHRVWQVQAGLRFMRKLALPGQRTLVVAEAELEARSTGSYSVRLYSTAQSLPGDDSTFFVAGLVRARDGVLDQVALVELDPGGPPSLVVVIRSVGSGGYLSADVFSVAERSLALRTSVAGLAPTADPVAALVALLHKSTVK